MFSVIATFSWSDLAVHAGVVGCALAWSAAALVAARAQGAGAAYSPCCAGDVDHADQAGRGGGAVGWWTAVAAGKCQRLGARQPDHWYAGWR
jgi:hypothetical protein